MIFKGKIVVRKGIGYQRKSDEEQALRQLHRDNHVKRRRPLSDDLCIGLSCFPRGHQGRVPKDTDDIITYRTFCDKWLARSLILTRSWVMASRSRKVTVSLRSGPCSPKVSK